MKQQVKNTIPVYDICTLNDDPLLHDEIIAEPFAAYLDAHPHLHFPHRHSFYHLVFFTGGTGTHTIDFEEFEVQAGQVYCMIPGQVHTWNFKQQPTGYIINFSEQLFHGFLADPHYIRQFPFFNGIAADSVLQLPVDVQEKIATLIEQLITELNNNNQLRVDYIRCCLIMILISISRTKKAGTVNSLPQHGQLVLDQFLQLTEQYYTVKRLPKEYAALMYITPNHLNALCQDLLGKSAGEIIRNRILLEAKRLLVNLELNISQIALQLNFTDNSYFTKFFKKYTETTPDEFRKLNSFTPK